MSYSDSEDGLKVSGSFIDSYLGRFPYVGKEATHLKKGDDKSKLLAVRGTVKVKVFDMSKPEDIKEYEKVSQGTLEGRNMPSQCEINFCQDTNNWRVFMRWIECVFDKKKGTD